MTIPIYLSDTPNLDAQPDDDQAADRALSANAAPDEPAQAKATGMPVSHMLITDKHVMDSQQARIRELEAQNENLRDSAQILKAQLAEARPCPHVITGSEGTQYCSLAEESVKRLEAQLASARVELGNKNGALGLREYMIQALREQIDEAEKSNAAHAGKLTETIEMICERQSRLREALEAVEWIGAQGMKCCPWCHSWKMDGHKPDCARQLALNPRGEGADVAAR